jgi:hypothetical protein
MTKYDIVTQKVDIVLKNWEFLLNIYFYDKSYDKI